MALEGERIAADEQVLVTGEAKHQIAGAIADEPVLRADAHDGGIEVLARLAIPAGTEWGLEKQPVVGDLDRCDLVH
jgi:hypothetical protein